MLVVGQDPGQHESDRDVEDGADDERAHDADRHVAHRLLGLLRGGRDCIEADEGKEHHRRAAHHAGKVESAGAAGIGRNEIAVWVDALTQFAKEKDCAAKRINRPMTISLIATMTSLIREDSRMPITSR